MVEILSYIAKILVNNPDAVAINEVEKDGEITLELRVAPEDMGRVIGKQGRIAKAIRSVIKAAGAKDGKRINVDILD